MDWSQRLQAPSFWLLTVTAAIAALHLALLNRVDQSDLFATSILFWFVAGSLLWERRHELCLESTIAPSVVGLGLIAFVLLRSAALPTSVTLLRLLPLMGLAGVCLLASGWGGLRQYWKELLIFGLLAAQPLFELLLRLLDLPYVTAKAGNFILWYTGFSVQRDGLFLILPKGRVEVYEACSGVQSVLFMLSIAVLFLLLFPPRSPSRKGQIVQISCCIGVAVVLGFVTNAVRVALMAILVGAVQNKAAFDYWHGGDGSLVFSMISVLLFGVFCWLVFLRHPPSSTVEGVQTNE